MREDLAQLGKMMQERESLKSEVREHAATIIGMQGEVTEARAAI